MKRLGIEGIYLGGWATSAKGSQQEDPGPDLASYPLSQVPNEAAPMVSRTLEALRQVGAPSFLTVLKHFGPSNPAPLSFPIPGWTLAADVPAAVNGLLEVLDELDEEVVAAGGRIYLAKDTRQSISAFPKAMVSYPDLLDGVNLLVRHKI
jgi:decaprenylphospho-beta-D-ribofuranose 2-oxidase